MAEVLVGAVIGHLFLGAPPAEAQTIDAEVVSLDGFSQLGREGDFPNGRNGLSLRSGICNVGDVDLDVIAPMDERHPVFAMQLYREIDGRFEQIGVSWVKHLFAALSGDLCGTCEDPPPDVTILGAGCSDVSSASSNGDRFWLGPRSEVNPFAGTWECEGSFFAGYEADCVRRSSGDGWDGVDHRLEVADADLLPAPSTVHFEGYLLVTGDADRRNAISSRSATVSGNAGFWSFVPTDGVVTGPAVLRWGDAHTWARIGPDDGELLLASRVTPEGARWRYEYAVFNLDSRRAVRTFEVPVGTAILSYLDYHDWDDDPTNDWNPTTPGERLIWETDPFSENPTANALDFGLLFNFGFTADAPPLSSTLTLGMFRPGPGGDRLEVVGPAPAGTVVVPGLPSGLEVARITRVGPNPSAGPVEIDVELRRGAEIRLDVFDAAGRRVRTLSEGPRSTGTARVRWDRRSAEGVKVGAGTYYVRLRVNGALAGTRSVVIVDRSRG